MATYRTCPAPISETRETRAGERTCSKDKAGSGLGCPAGYAYHSGYFTDRSKPPKFCAGDGLGKIVPRYAAKCFRSTYPRDQLAIVGCCTGRYGDTTCDPAFCEGSAECGGYMRQYCETTADWAGDPACIQFYSRNPQFKAELYARKCRGGALSPGGPCSRYCRDTPGGCPGIIDDRHCVLHPTDPLCACINSKLNTAESSATAPPSCFDAACKTTGYQTASMASTAAACPNFIDCRQYTNLINDGTIKDLNILQNCAIEFQNSKAAAAAAGPPGAAAAKAAAANPGAAAAANKTAELIAAVERRAADNPAPPAWKQSYDRTYGGFAEKHPDVDAFFDAIIPSSMLMRSDYTPLTAPGGVALMSIKPLLFLFLFMLILIIIGVALRGKPTVGGMAASVGRLLGEDDEE